MKGTGRKGRITKEDVEQAEKGGGDGGGADAAPAGGDAAGSELGLAPWPKVDFEKCGDVERVQLSRIKRISGPNLARNWVRIPHVTHQEDADITDLEAFRKQLNAEQSDVKVTMVALLVKACVASLQGVPERSTRRSTATSSCSKRYCNIGFAADTPNGLIVPVIKDADAKGILAIGGELHGALGQGPRGQARPDGDAGRDVHDLVASAASAGRASRRSSTRPRWRSSAPPARDEAGVGRRASSSRG